MDDRAPNIRHYAAFASTVRHGSLSRAARAVNLSQPALTQAIRGLEATLGVVLFDRGAAGMMPTEPARLLASRAEAAVSHIGSARVTGTQIRAFLAVARAGSYAGAAEATGISPPSLHRAVADLAVALGQRLIERRGRSLLLTAAGQRRARGFALALSELRAGISEISSWQGKAGGRIVIGAMPLSRARWLPQALARFAADHPDIDLAVIEGSHTELAGPLRDGDIDLVLGALRDAKEIEDLAQEPVFEDRPSLVMRSGHPILARDAREVAGLLLDFPWILPGRDTPLRRYWEQMMAALGHQPPRVGIECGSVLMIRELLLAGDGLTLLSPDQVAVELKGGILRELATPVPIRRVIGMTTRAGWRPPPIQAAFLAQLRETGLNLLPNS